MAVPVLLGFRFDMYHEGFCMALGVLFTFLPNVEGRHKYRLTGMFLALLLSLVLVAIQHVIVPLGAAPILLLLFTSFLLVSQLSIFGFRGGMVAFSGQLALIMSFAISELSLAEKLSYLALGSFIYLTMSAIFHKLHEPIYVRNLLAKVLDDTAHLLKIRFSKRFGITPLSPLNETQLQLDLIKNHAILREILYTGSAKAHHLSIFLEALDLFEIALGSAAIKQGEHQDIPNEIRELAASNIIYIHALAEAVKHRKDIPLSPLNEESAQAAIEHFVVQTGLPAARPKSLYFRTLLDEELEIQTHILRALKVEQSKVATKEFVDVEYYSWRSYLASFDWKNPVFKHSFRTAIVMTLGFAIGTQINELKAYWIILTIAVILRPNYGLTRQRASQRVVGTLWGSALVGA